MRRVDLNRTQSTLLIYKNKQNSLKIFKIDKTSLIFPVSHGLQFSRKNKHDATYKHYNVK